MQKIIIASWRLYCPTKTKDVHMLEERNDLAVLFDIRVVDGYKHQGIGYHLFNYAKKWSKETGLKELKIECQNINYDAVNFYYRQSATLCSIKEFVYPDYPNEVQLLWYLDL